MGPVALYGLDQGKQDLSWAKWTYQVRYLDTVTITVTVNVTTFQ